MNLFRAFIHLPALLIDAQAIGTDVQQVQSDPKILAELASAPLLAAEIAEIGAEWRAVETDAASLKSGSLLQKFSRLQRLLTDVGKLEAATAHLPTDPALLAELVNCPNVQTALDRISAEWRKLESDVR